VATYWLLREAVSFDCSCDSRTPTKISYHTPSAPLDVGEYGGVAGFPDWATWARYLLSHLAMSEQAMSSAGFEIAMVAKMPG